MRRCGACGIAFRGLGQVTRCRARDHRAGAPTRGHLRLGCHSSRSVTAVVAGGGITVGSPAGDQRDSAPGADRSAVAGVTCPNGSARGDRLRTPPAVVGRRHLRTPAPARPGRGRRGGGNRLGHLGGLHHRPRASACGRCPHRSTASTRLKGGPSGGTPGRDAVAEPRRPPGGGGAGGEGLGRSRGRSTTKAGNRLKQHRAVATRYDKRGYVCLGTATAAALTVWLRT